jgi:hypothetical protein
MEFFYFETDNWKEFALTQLILSIGILTFIGIEAHQSAWLCSGIMMFKNVFEKF